MMTSGGLTYDIPDQKKKNDRDSFVMIFDAHLNAAYRVPLHDPGAELEGGSNTPGQARVNALSLRCPQIWAKINGLASRE